MEELLNYICAHASYAHYIIFGLLLLAGLNIPITSDILILGGGAIASLCLSDEHTVRLFLWIYVGGCLAGWEGYWIGRLFGPKLFKISWFRHFLSEERLTKLTHYYNKFGIWTFIVGRFIPGGVRNAIFMSSGLTKMPFHLFIIRDGIGYFIASAVLFYIGHTFGENLHFIVTTFQRYTEWVIGLIAIVMIAVITLLWCKHKAKRDRNQHQDEHAHHP